MKKNLLIISVFCLSVLFAGCQTPTTPGPAEEIAPDQAEQNTKVSINIVDEEGNTSTEETNVELAETDSQEAVADDKAPVYKDYVKEDYLALKGSKPFVLFFHAGWCPICREMEKTYTEELSTFPEGTIILKTDYDLENELKIEHNVNIQSTVIVFDAGGNAIYTTQDPSLEDFMAAIKTSLSLS